MAGKKFVSYPFQEIRNGIHLSKSDRTRREKSKSSIIARNYTNILQSERSQQTKTKQKPKTQKYHRRSKNKINKFDQMTYLDSLMMSWFIKEASGNFRALKSLRVCCFSREERS